MKVIRPAGQPKLLGKPEYDAQTELYPRDHLPPYPIASEEMQRLKVGDAEVGNYNYVMAVLLRMLHDKAIQRDGVMDIMFKAEKLYRESYRQIHGKDPAVMEART